jgi:hypothetical protein
MKTLYFLNNYSPGSRFFQRKYLLSLSLMLSWAMLSATLGFGQSTLILWNFQNAAQPAPEPFLSTPFDERMNPSPLIRGEGVAPASQNSGFVASNWDAQSKADAIDQGEYLQFTVDPKDVFQVSLATLHAVIYRTIEGPNVYQFQYSLDGFQTAGIDIGPQVTLRRAIDAAPSAEFGTAINPPIDLTSVTNLQEVPGTTTITFRVYAWGSLTTGGIFGFYYRDDIQTLRIIGEIAPVANPAYIWSPTNPGTGADLSIVGPDVAGAITGNFQSPENWTPNRTDPTPNDILLFDLGGSTLVSGVEIEEVHQIWINNNTEVTFQPTISTAGGAPPSSITFNAPAPGFALVLEPGSTMRFLGIQGTRTMVFQFPANTQALIGGTVIFDTSPDVAVQEYVLRQAHHRLLAADPDAIIFQSGSSFVAGKFSGNPFGDEESPAGYTTPGSVIFQSGSTYLSLGGLNPFGLAPPASKVVFESGSTFILEDYDFIPNIAGRTYANFVVNLVNLPEAAQTLNFDNIDTNLPFTVDDITIEAGILNLYTGPATNPLNINVNGSLSVNENAAFNYDPPVNDPPVASTLTLTGTTQPNTISGGGDITFGENTTLQLNTPSFVTLARPLELDGNLQLTQGVLFTSAVNLLTINPTGSIIGGSSESFIDGPLQKGVATAGTITLNFPLGNQDFPLESQYRPVTLELNLPTAEEVYFTATKVQGSPEPPNRLLGTGLENISTVRHYTIVKEPAEVQVLGGTITITYGEDDEVTDPENLRIATDDFDGTAPIWSNLGGEGTGAPTGSITAALPDDPAFTFGIFVLANALGGENPLPVAWLSVEAVLKQEGVLVRWQTGSETNNRGFEVERSLNGTEWQKAGFVAGKGTSTLIQTYQFLDKTTAPEVSTLYYRIKQLDFDGTFDFSKVVAVQLDALPPRFALYPNPVADILHLHLGKPGQNVRLRIINLLGQVVLEKAYSGQTLEVSENIASLPAGAYQLEVYQDEGRTMRRFLKGSR